MPKVYKRWLAVCRATEQGVHCALDHLFRDLSVTWFGDKALIKSRNRQGAGEGRGFQ